MVNYKYDNKLMEEICENLLSPEDNEIKKVGSYIIPTEIYSFNLLEEQILSLESQIKNIKLALTLGKLAKVLNAKLFKE